MENLINVKNLESEWSIYLLTCKHTPNTVYVGITNEEYVIARLFRHFSECVAKNRTKNDEKHEWVRNNWQYLEMEVIEHNIFDESIARQKEAEYVFKYLNLGYKVLNKTYTPIRVFDKFGNYYKDFPTYTAAAEEFNVLPCRVISCCSQGNRLLGKYYIKKYDPSVFNIEVNTNNIPVDKDVPVLQYDLEGNLIKKWNNAYIVSKTLNIDRSQLSKCLKGINKTSKGFIFRYENNTDDVVLYKVFMYDTDYKLIKKFKTNKECAEYLVENNISKGKINVVASSISLSIKKNRKYLNYVFSKTELENLS